MLLKRLKQLREDAAWLTTLTEDRCEHMLNEFFKGQEIAYSIAIELIEDLLKGEK